MASPPSSLTAVVLGATGAVGTEVVRALIESDAWIKITTIGRRPVELSDELKAKAGERLQQLAINMDNMAAEGGAAFAGATSVFCTLGTTRAVAGSAAAFRKVDLDWVAESARLAAAGSAKHFALCSSTGANANVWACDWLVSSPLLYMKVKGQAEEAVKAAGIPTVSIYRPGLLERGERERGTEKAMAALFTKISVSAIGRMMVQDAEAAAAGARSPTVATFTMKDMMAAAKSGKAPVMSA
ncbi:hypothetical protein FOA52_006984 [Chlamydomonas sp. UWO 241]|nr:hypothetical protein FOA52_006984 [Chlamydomonas sp. UWO 241]